MARNDATPTDADYGADVIRMEIRALDGLLGRLGDEFAQACETLFACNGRIVVTGMGKTGIIAQKISATLASTGTPSLFLHPADAVHGDLGRVVTGDVLLAMSNSGESEEVLRLVPRVKRVGVTIIALTGKGESTLARHSDIVLDMGPIEEACPLGLAPSASTTALLAMGDALALTIFRRRDFGPDEFAMYHPGGDIGRRLLKVDEIMRTGERCPTVAPATTVREALEVISGVVGRAGATSVVDPRGRLLGIFTDGDLKRQVIDGVDVARRRIEEVMTSSPKVIRVGSLATEAAAILHENRIDELPVVDEENRLVGILDVQDFLDAGLI